MFYTVIGLSVLSRILNLGVSIESWGQHLVDNFRQHTNLGLSETKYSYVLH